MRFFASLVLLATLVWPLSSRAQTVTVETLVPADSQIDDALTLGPDGALYGSRFGGAGDTVTRVDVETGATAVYAAGFLRANGLVFGNDGTLYVANYGRGQVMRVPLGGKPAVHGQETTTVSGLAIHPETGVLYVASYDGRWVKTLSASGVFTDVVTSGIGRVAGLAFDDQNRLYVANFDNGAIYRIEGNQATLFANVGTSVGFITYGGGRFFATGINSNRIYAVSASGDVSVLAGSAEAGTVDGSAATARFDGPNGIVSTANGDTLYVSQSGSRAVRRILIQTPTQAEHAPEASAPTLGIAPNPASGAAAVRFELSEPSEVTVDLRDVLGRRLRVLATGPYAAGSHAVPLDLQALAAGTYAVTLSHSRGVVTRLLTHP